MGYIHTLKDAMPPERTDEVPWEEVRVEESETSDGDYTALATRDLATGPGVLPVGLDEDPLYPQMRSITFESALLEGYFRLVFIDGNSDESAPTAPVFDDGTDVEAIAWAPTLAEVASLVLTRTKGTFERGGQYYGTFNNDTIPTDDQAAQLILLATGTVASTVGETPCNAVLSGRAGHLAALYAAMMIELSHYPEQVNANKSPYPEYAKLYESGLDRLIASIEKECGEDLPGGGDSGGSGRPDYNFSKSRENLGMEIEW